MIYKVLIVMAIISVMIFAGLEKVELVYQAKERLLEKGAKRVLVEKFYTKLLTKNPSIPLEDGILNIVCDSFSNCQVDSDRVTVCENDICVDIERRWLEAKLKASY